MCGIAGLLDPAGARDGELGHLASAMANALVHRGPDDFGLWEDRSAGIDGLSGAHRVVITKQLLEERFDAAPDVGTFFHVVRAQAVAPHDRLGIGANGGHLGVGGHGPEAAHLAARLHPGHGGILA